MIDFIVATAWIATSPRFKPEFAMTTAHAIANYAGYTRSAQRRIDYERTDPKGRSLYPGFITVQIMSNGHDVFDVSVDKAGRAFDFNRCFVFDYRFLRMRQTQARRMILKPYRIVMNDNGCRKFRILRRRGDEG